MRKCLPGQKKPTKKTSLATPGPRRRGILLLANSFLPDIVSPRSANDLMLRVQAGDLAAFEELVERYQDVVYGLAISLLRNPEDAEEAAQDAFLKLYRARGSFDSARALEPWLLRIAGNVARDRLRRRKTRWLPVLEPRGDEDPSAQVADPRAPNAGQAAIGQTVLAQLARLSDRVRVPLELKYLRGFSNQEIATALGISISNVKVLLARGKDLLQSRLQGDLEGEAGS